MKSLIGGILNKAPVAYVSRALNLPIAPTSGTELQLRSMSSNGTLFAMVHRLSNATAQVEWKLWRKAKSGKPEDRVEVTKHAALDLWNKPNPFMTRQEFIEAFQQHLDLTGEAWWIVGSNPLMRKLPLELWPVRPDRMGPVPDPDLFIKRYEYTGPNGERVPLEREEVVFLRMPNPMDPYRGLGPIQSILMNLDAAKYSAEWNRNFFVNSAEPGGIVQVEQRLSDDEFNEMRDRWHEQHRGVANAHRVAILEQGAQWVDRKYTQRDMQFAELATVNRETLREAFGFPKPMLGASDDVNRANAEAAEVVFGRWLVVPRLERIKGAVNNDLLPLFGPTAEGLEFDYESPVPEDAAAENAALTAKSQALKIFVELGATWESACEALELPEMEFEKPPPPPPPMLPPGAAPPEGDPEEEAPAEEKPVPPKEDPKGKPDAYRRPLVLNAAEDVNDVDLSQVQASWERAVELILAQWGNVTDRQREELIAQVIAAIDADDVEALARLTCSSEAGSALILEAMNGLAADAAHQVVTEAYAQGVYSIQPMVPVAEALESTAKVTAAMLAAEMALSAGREALRVRSPGASGREVAGQVANHLRSLTDAFPRKEIGGALTGAQNAGRIETFRAGPVAALYANEKLDKNTCGPCRAVHGRWLGNSDNGTDMEQINKTYPTSGYVDCEGGARCRGTVTGVWRSKTA